MIDPGLLASALDIFSDTITRSPDEQRRLLEELRSADPAMHGAVVSLLDADTRPEPEINAQLPRIADDLLGEAEDPYLGTMIGPYHVQSVLGTGGMGRVYLAVHQNYQGFVALKILSDSFSPERRNRFELEKAHLAKFRHPAIAQMYYADTLPSGTAYFAMEYVEGKPITTYCKEARTSLPERLRLFLQVCGAVQAAHGQGIIHRDLKPSNILVRADGTAKLLDFGIAEETGGATERPGGFISLRYAPPEHAEMPPGVEGDVYSLGIILQEMITGRAAFETEGSSPERLREAIRSGALPPPSASAREGDAAGSEEISVARSAWVDLDHICAKARARRPEDRYPTVEALARDVRLHLAVQPLATIKRTTWYTAGRFVRRNRGPVSIAGVALLLVVSLVAVYTFRLARARDAALAEAAHSARVERFLEGLFTGGDGDAGPSEDMRVVTLLQTGVQNAGALSNDPGLQADLYHTLGTVYEDLGSYEESDRLLNAALAERSRVFGRDSPEAAKTLIELAKLRDEERKLPEAEALAQEAVGVDTRKLPPNHPETLRAETTLAAIYTTRGENQRAVAILEKVMQTDTEANASLSDLSETLTDLSIAEENLGHVDAAESATQRALEIDRKLVGDRHPDVASDLMTLVDIDEQRGQNDLAVRHAAEALEIERQWFRPDHPEVASAMTSLGQALAKAGRGEEALPLLEASLAIQEKVYQVPNSRMAQTLNALGSAERRSGNLGEAAKFYGRAVEVYRTIYPHGNQNTGVALFNTADVSFDRGQYLRAEMLAREALDIESKRLAPDDWHIASAEILLGKTLTAERRYGEAEPLLLTGYKSLSGKKRGDPGALGMACSALADLYAAMHNKERSTYFRSLSEQMGASKPS